MHRRRSLLALFVASLAPAQAASIFIRVPLGRGASIEIPKNWEALSGSQRTTIEAFVEAKGFRQVESSLSFAAKLFDDSGKTLATLEARYYPENKFVQSEAQALTPADVQAIDVEVRKSVEASLKSMGVSLIEWYGSKIERINGLYVYVHEQQHSGVAEIEPIRMRGLRVWASPRSFTVTLSYRERQGALLRPIVDRMASSLRLD